MGLRLFGMSMLALLLSACGGSEGNEATPPEPCSGLKGRTFGEGIVDEATSSNGECKVNGSIRTDLRFQIHLPDTWNKKLVFGGGGGWDGMILPFTYSPSTSGGYVLVFSNGGHESDAAVPPFDASFALNNPQAREDFAYLSSHATLLVARDIVRAHYGEAPARSYFEGCSNGGREALMQATHFPEDYDAIVSRAPAYDFTSLLLAFLNNAKQVRHTAGGALDVVKLRLLSNAVLQACDALDGLEDGIVSDPARCTFDPAALRCAPGTEGSDCLTDAQMDTVATVYSPYVLNNGTTLYPGWGPGGESNADGWPMWLGTSATTPMAGQHVLAEGLVKYWLMEEPDYDVSTFVPEEHLDRIAAASAMLDATPDLAAFFAAGRKLILAHGTTDWAISYKSSIDYFEEVSGAVGGAAVRDASMEFFLQPGVQHCQGGDGPDVIDLLEAADRWVEAGERPSAQGLIAEKRDGGGEPTLRRPLCPYPTFPQYKGSGDPASADSFSCVAP
ncbi:tannase/feruloyl esterase family alpha/beta hydrolase [Chondromyces crocatus]|nr:tannase/feruloyl esterase family alpha/beta hydrolase [Chondromyces crocatus]